MAELLRVGRSSAPAFGLGRFGLGLCVQMVPFCMSVLRLHLMQICNKTQVFRCGVKVPYGWRCSIEKRYRFNPYFEPQLKG